MINFWDIFIWMPPPDQIYFRDRGFRFLIYTVQCDNAQVYVYWYPILISKSKVWYQIYNFAGILFDEIFRLETNRFVLLIFQIVLMASQLGVTKDFPLEGLHLFAMRIVVVNSMLNPLAYVALCKSYRCGILYYFRKLFSICCGVESSPSVDFWSKL